MKRKTGRAISEPPVYNGTW